MRLGAYLLTPALVLGLAISPAYSQQKVQREKSTLVFPRPGGYAIQQQREGRSVTQFYPLFRRSSEPPRSTYLPDRTNRYSGNWLIQNPFDKRATTVRSEPGKVPARLEEKGRLWWQRNVKD